MTAETVARSRIVWGDTEPHAALHDAATQPAVHGGHAGKKLAVLVGTKKAIWIAVGGLDSTQRITTLKERLACVAPTVRVNS